MSSHDSTQLPVEEPEIVEAHVEEQPTDSPLLANAEPEEYGAAQVQHNQTEVKDLGWNESSRGKGLE